MDGNGRWAESHGLERIEGHRVGVDAVKTIVKACLQKNIAVLSLFAFSSENWSRPTVEVDFLMQLFLQALAGEIQELHERGVRLRFIGNRHQLSSTLCTQMQTAEELTCNNSQLHLNVMMNYGGKWDILQAAKLLAKQVADGSVSLENINEDGFAKLLSTADVPDPDLFIRTSGEERISNFFLWQLAYTELYFSDVFWPDFTAEHFEAALTSFSQRKRRYGLTAKQSSENGYV